MHSIFPARISVAESQAIQTQNQLNKNPQLVTFTNEWEGLLEADGVRKIGQVSPTVYKEGLKKVQIGDEFLDPHDYYDEYKTVNIGENDTDKANYVTYAIRFKGTKYESAWRYEFKKNIAKNGGNRLIIKNVMLWMNSGKTLTQGTNSIALEEFFNKSNTVERIIPAYGFIPSKGTITDISSMSLTGFRYVNLWLSTIVDEERAYTIYAGETSSPFSIIGTDERYYGFAIRPFARN